MGGENRREEIELSNRNEEGLAMIGEEARNETNSNRANKLLMIHYILQKLSWCLIFFSFLLQSFALFINIDTNSNNKDGIKNIFGTAQFITNCTTNISQNSTKVYLKCSENNLCFVEDQDIFSTELAIRCITYFFFLFMCAAYSRYTGMHPSRTRRELRRRGITEEDLLKSYERRKLGCCISSWIVFISAIYLIPIAIIQAKGLNIQGLEMCDINQELLSSKTGYLEEWASHNWNTTNGAFSKITKQLSLT